MINTNKILLILASILLFIGLVKPDLSKLIPGVNSNPKIVNTIKLEAPTDEAVLAQCDEVIKALSEDNDRATDGKRLSSLYSDLSELISLDDKNEVIRNTEEIRQANRLSGIMLQMDIKDKYPSLAEANEKLIILNIGDDNIPLTKDLRAKAVQAFRALAWACYEGSK